KWETTAAGMRACPYRLGVCAGGREKPMTVAPSRSSHSAAQEPMKLVWPVSMTCRPAQNSGLGSPRSRGGSVSVWGIVLLGPSAGAQFPCADHRAWRKLTLRVSQAGVQAIRLIREVRFSSTVCDRVGEGENGGEGSRLRRQDLIKRV